MSLNVDDLNIRLNDSEISGSPSGPKPPVYSVRPNPSIPITIGILMLLGSLAVSIIGGTYIIGHYTNPSDAEIEQSLKLSGTDMTVEEYKQAQAELVDSGLLIVSGATNLIAAFTMMFGSIMLILKKERGPKIALIGALVWFISQLITEIWSSILGGGVAVDKVELIATAFCLICNLTCMGLPFFVTMNPAAVAALQSSKTEEPNS